MYQRVSAAVIQSQELNAYKELQKKDVIIMIIQLIIHRRLTLNVALVKYAATATVKPVVGNASKMDVRLKVI